MAQQTLNNGETGSVIRDKTNDNFDELYTDKLTSAQKTDLTDGGSSSLHTHNAVEILSLDTEISNNTSVSENTAKITNATHTGEVTGSTTLTIADNVVDEANLKLDESATNGYILKANSAKSGGMEWSARDLQSFVVACSDETSALTIGTAKVTFRMPYSFTVTEVQANVTTAPTDASLIVDINQNDTSIMTTNKLTILTTTKVDDTTATITTTALVKGDKITIDIDQVGSTIAGAGLKVAIIGRVT